MVLWERRVVASWVRMVGRVEDGGLADMEGGVVVGWFGVGSGRLVVAFGGDERGVL